MNNLITGFDKILGFAKDQGLPVDKKRGVLREYLQSKFLVEFYSLPKAKKMSFVGGTSLRMLRGLPRFSEDLDFDNLGLSDKDVLGLIEETIEGFERENVWVELKKKQGERKTYFELRFPKILFDLKISSNEKEKMMIKVDYARYWKHQEVESKLFSRYGLIEQVVTNKLDQLLVQKLAAYVGRARTQARDIYDIVWLYSQGAKIDKKFAKGNGVAGVLDKAKLKFDEEGVSALMRRRLKPFLFDEKELGKLDLLGSVLERL
jgi:predicted nucleotidyltransferase component of viral defense system